MASLACGLAGSQEVLVIARAVQGLGGAVVSAVALSLIMELFTEPGERAKAMGIYRLRAARAAAASACCSAACSPTSSSWHWMFLVNVPIGVAVYVFSLRSAGRATRSGTARALDVGGRGHGDRVADAAVYAIVNGNEAGWTSAQTLGLLGAAVAALGTFLVIETRVAHR